MRDVIGLLEDYGRTAEARVTPVEIDTIVGPLAEAVPLEGRKQLGLRSRPRWAVVVAVASLILVLIGGVALLALLAAEEEPPVITRDPAPTSIVSPTSVPTPTSLPTPTSVPASTTVPAPAEPVLTIVETPWTELAGQERAFALEDDQFMEAATTGGPGLVAVGGACAEACLVGGPGGLRDPDGLFPQGDSMFAAVWVSPDGSSWSRVPHDPAVFGGSGDQMMLGVAGTSSGVVAVGFDDHGNLAGTRFPGMHMLDREGDLDLDGAIWFSPNGETWTRLADEDALWSGPGDQIVEAVVAGGPGYVAVGSVEGNAAVWVSDDGTSWTRVADDPSVFGSDSAVWMHDVAIGGPGLVAVGTDWNGGWTEEGAYPHAAVWVSPDGLEWARVPHDDAVFGGTADVGMLTMWSVDASDDMVVAAGYSGRLNRQAIWASSDGTNWDRLDDAGTAPTNKNPLSSVAVADGRAVLTGWEQSFTEYPDDRRRYERDSTTNLVADGSYRERGIASASTPLIARRDVVLVGDVLIAVGWTGEPCVNIAGSPYACGSRTSTAAVWIGEVTQ